MIVDAFDGTALRCTGCGFVIELSKREKIDGYRRTLKIEKLASAHAGCDKPRPGEVKKSR